MPQTNVDKWENLSRHYHTQEAQLHGTQHDLNFGFNLHFDKQQTATRETQLLNPSVTVCSCHHTCPPRKLVLTVMTLIWHLSISYKRNRCFSCQYSSASSWISPSYWQIPQTDFQVSSRQPLNEKQFSAFRPMNSNRDYTAMRSNPPRFSNKYQPKLINPDVESTVQSTTQQILLSSFDKRVYGKRKTQPTRYLE